MREILNRFAFFAALVLIIGLEANAQMVSAFARERSGTLPQGRFFISLVSITGSLDSLYGADGRKKSLSSNFSQNISFGKISSEEPIRKRQLAGLFKSNGVALDDSAGQLSGDISGTISGKVPVLGYGISDRLGVYVTIPIIRFQVSSAYQFGKSSTAQKFLARLNSTDQRSTALEIENAFNSSLENKLYKAGYEWNPNRDQTYLGDIQVLFLQTLNAPDATEFKQSVQPSLTLPTATAKGIQDLYGLQAGHGRLGLGLKYSLEQKIAYPLQANFSLGGTYLFANHQARRLPLSNGDELNEYLDEDVAISGGMQAQSQAQLRYAFPKWVGLSVGILWQRELSEHMEGSAYPAESYQLASARTDRELLSTYAAIDLNSIQSFLEGNFWFPAMAELGVGLPIRGRNAVSEPVIQLQGSLFF